MDSRESDAPDHPDLKVKRWETISSKIRKTYLYSGISPRSDVKCYNNTISGMERALKERLFHIPDPIEGWIRKPTHALGVVKEKMAPFLAAMKPLSSYTHPWTREAFANSYTGQKKNRYLRAASQLNNDALRPQDSELKFFMKLECYLELKSPRGINPPSDRYLVELGRYIKPLEKLVYNDVERLFGYKAIVKGLNQSARGKLIYESWTTFSDPVAIMLDASKFEQSVSAECIDFESDLYNLYYHDKLLRFMMRLQRSYRGRARSADGCLSFKIEGVRASGMNNTALGNCVISAGFIYDIRRRLREIDQTFEMRVHIDGDDVVVIMSRRHAELFRSFSKPYYAEASFRMKMEATVDIIEHIDFCQSRPVFDGENYIMLRNMKTSLAKDAVSKKPLDNRKVFQKWSAAVGMGGVACCGGMPVHQSFYNCILRASKGAKPLENDPLQRSMRLKTQGMTRVLRDVLPVTRCSYWLAFGIEPDAQIAIEKQLDLHEIEFGVPEQDIVRHLSLPWGQG